MKFNIITFGCKVNQYESNMMKEKMLSSNFLYEENYQNSDIIIINTCTVTNTADNKCLKMARRIKRECPNAYLAIVGCSTQNNEDVYKELNPNIILGNKDKSKIDKLIKDSKEYFFVTKERNLEFEDMILNDYNHIRAFIKVEDGCDNFCSYCIIPYVRGSVRSKDFDVCLKEAEVLAKNGHKEIVLTGIHTGRYENNGKDLTDLINALSKISEIKRIRISSIEITELNDKFLNMLKENSKVCNHLHIPLQAGSDEILKKMNRKYDLAYYTDVVNKIRAIRPDISLSTDVIVGHPYETEELFLETKSYCENIKFSKIHVFPYSKRNGTAASKMPNQVPGDVKKRRAKELIALSNYLEEEYFNSFKGKTVDVLIEECDNGKSIGHTSNYLKVELDEKLEIGSIYSREL